MVTFLIKTLNIREAIGQGSGDNLRKLAEPQPLFMNNKNVTKLYEMLGTSARNKWYDSFKLQRETSC